jgi:hypothetical protein
MNYGSWRLIEVERTHRQTTMYLKEQRALLLLLLLHNYNTTVWQSRETKTNGTTYTTLWMVKKYLKIVPAWHKNIFHLEGPRDYYCLPNIYLSKITRNSSKLWPKCSTVPTYCNRSTLKSLYEIRRMFSYFCADCPMSQYLSRTITHFQ